MRLLAYTGASVAVAGFVIVNALHQRANFYSACVYLSQSNANLLALTNVTLLAAGWTLYGLQHLLYGPLRAIEREQLYERAWFAVTETCLAMTMFRDEMSQWFLVMFLCLLVGKIWNWIGEGRVELAIQRLPEAGTSHSTRFTSYFRLFASLSLPIFYHVWLLHHCANTVLQQAKPDMMVMFGFEFAILSTLSCSTFIRYCFALYEARVCAVQKQERLREERKRIYEERQQILERAAETGETVNDADLPSEEEIDEVDLDVPGWEEKGRWLFCLEMLTDLVKLVIYICFFAILFTFYGLPIHIIRDMVLTMRSFAKRVLDFTRFRAATRDMNSRYPDATAEQLRSDDVCIICREEMRAFDPSLADTRHGTPERMRPKRLPCGHVLHLSCLRSWLERQQICPTCRRPVTDPPTPSRDAAAGDVNDAIEQGRRRRGRAWFLNLGPIRIGFGAGRDVLPDLNQQAQAQEGNAERNQHQQPPQENGQLPEGLRRLQLGGNPIQNPARSFGFTFGFGQNARRQALNAMLPQGGAGAGAGAGVGTGAGTGAAPTAVPIATAAPAVGATIPATAPAAGTTSQNAQAQLNVIEQQIEQELAALSATRNQLQVVRLLQGELNRLRNSQSELQTRMPGSALGNGGESEQATQTPRGLFGNSPQVAQRFVSTSRHSAISTGDPRLPEGVTLPEGWTLLPLHSADTRQATPSMLTPHDGANVPTPTINPASGPAGNRGEQQPQEPATDIYRSHQEQSNPTEVATSQPSESTLVPTQTAQEGTEGERSSTRSPFAAYDPLPPEVQSREEDRPIPRDDSTSSSIDDLDEVWRQEPSHFAALGSPKKSQADNPSEGETRPLESGSNEAAVAASSEKAGHEHERPSSSSPSGEDKGKYRATVEESFDDDDIA